jgi:hypothetical protein
MAGASDDERSAGRRDRAHRLSARLARVAQRAAQPAVESTSVGDALLVHPRGFVDRRALDFTRGLAPDSQHTLVVLDLPAWAEDSLWESVARVLDRKGASFRLVPGRGSRDEVRRAAQWLADRLDRIVLAPDGTVVPAGGGALFVPVGHGTGWLRYRPKRSAALDSRRFPKPQWEYSVPDRPQPIGATAMVEPLPGGVWIRGSRDAASSSSDRKRLFELLAVDAELLGVVLGSRGTSGVLALDLEEIAAFWDTIPGSARHMVRFVPYGRVAVPGSQSLGQALADRLGQRVVVHPGVPVPGQDGISREVRTLLGDGSLGWRPYADEFGYVPRSENGGRLTPPLALGARTPTGTVTEVAPGVYQYAPDVFLEVVQSGLWVRPPAEPLDGYAVRTVPADPASSAILYDQHDPRSADRMRSVAFGLVKVLDASFTGNTRVLPAGEPGRVDPAGVPASSETHPSALVVSAPDGESGRPGPPAAAGPQTKAGPVSGRAPGRPGPADTWTGDPFAPGYRGPTTPGPGTPDEPWSDVPNVTQAPNATDGPKKPNGTDGPNGLTPGPAVLPPGPIGSGASPAVIGIDVASAGPVVPPAPAAPAQPPVPGPPPAVPTRLSSASEGTAPGPGAGVPEPNRAGAPVPVKDPAPARDDAPPAPAVSAASAPLIRLESSAPRRPAARPTTADGPRPAGTGNTGAAVDGADTPSVPGPRPPSPDTPPPLPPVPAPSQSSPAEPTAPAPPVPLATPTPPATLAPSMPEPPRSPSGPGAGADGTVRVQPEPAPGASVLPPAKGLERERDWMRRSIGARYDTAAAFATRVLSESPGLHGGPRSSVGDAVTDLAAVRLYLTGSTQAIDAAIRSAAAGPHVPLARCVASGLRRLPSHRGGAVLRASLGPAERAWYREGTVVVERSFLAASTVIRRDLPGDTDILLWSLTARRTALVVPDVPDRLLFAPDTRFKVLRTVGGDRPAVMMREMAAAELDENGQPRQERVRLDDVALAGLDQLHAVWQQAEAGTDEETAGPPPPADHADAFHAAPGLCRQPSGDPDAPSTAHITGTTPQQGGMP